MDNHTALIIDDEPDIRELLEITLGRMQIASTSAGDLAGAKELLRKNSYDICLTDMRLPDGDGVEFVGYIQEYYPQMPIAVITAHGNMETAILALKSGAFDFLSKPIDLSRLRILIENALKLSSRKREPGQELIGTSKAVEDIRSKIAKLARSQAPVYISGESGVGKELAARMIHEQGPRSGKAFVPVNCGAIPQDLMESEFFGHKKGSFTGAVSDKDGLFQAADGGTLFLDEIAELPPHMQVKLLRAIQEKTIRAIGSQQELPVDVRILSATHKDLAALVEEGKFRQDLFYRINVIELHIDPLRDRREDISLLITKILEKLTQAETGRKPVLGDDALAALNDYPFPGNIRELENILERAMTLCDGNVITEKDLQLPAAKQQGEAMLQEKKGAALDSYLVDIERQTILEALEKTRWNRTAAAKLLGISLRALRYRLEKLGMGR